MADLRLFVECTTKAVFDSHLAAGDITNNHIVFIQGTNQLYHNGVYYGLSAADASKLAEVYARKEFGKISDGTEISGSGELVVYSATKAEDTLIIKASSETGEVMNVTASANGFQIKLVAEEGTTNGTIKLNGNAVAVHGLGSAAYTDSTAYDAAGDADAAEAAAKGYADNITVNGKGQTNQAITIDGSDIDLTGYAEASAKAAVAATDDVNAAIGKLEYRLDNLDLGDATSASKDAFLTSTAFTGTPTAPTAAVNTNTTQIATTAFVKAEIDDKIVGIQAMQFKGVADSAEDLDADALPGWTYRAGTAFTLGSEEVEVGDMIICTAAKKGSTSAQWAVVQNNIDGAVVGPDSSTDGHIAIFDGATGKVIEDSGFTIATSVPANAVFTDTTYNVFNTTTDGLVPAADGTGETGMFLKGDGTWAAPANTEYTFADGSDGSFTVTPTGGSAQTVSIGKPATAGTADEVAHDLSITLGASGTAQTFDGSADLSVTVTPAAIGAAEAVHTHTSDQVTIGDGYSKPQTVTAISTSDTVQAAIGKLEAMFDWVVYNS